VGSIAEGRRAELEMAGCELQIHLSAEDPTLAGNSEQLREVLNNLITNARQAMEGQAREKVVTLTTFERGERVGVRVEDTGAGVPKQIISKIFEPFFTTRGEAGATGLGLSVAHNIVTTHHGRIWYEKRPLGGAAFVVELPKAEVSAASMNGEGGSQAAKILIVDDEEALCAILKEMLGMLGHTVDVSQLPSEALEKIKVDSFDLIISDFRMPGMNGADFYAEALKIQEGYRKKFIFLTGDVVNEAAREFFSKVPVPRLLKPFEFQEVEKLIQTVLRGNSVSGDGSDEAEEGGPGTKS
jgi:CheY-like chemotaxis protein